MRWDGEDIRVKLGMEWEKGWKRILYCSWGWMEFVFIGRGFKNLYIVLRFCFIYDIWIWGVGFMI